MSSAGVALELAPPAEPLVFGRQLNVVSR